MKPDRRLMSRREFLIAAGCGCVATVLVGSGCARNSAAAADTVVCPYGYVYDTWPGQCPRYVDSNGSGYCDYSDPIAATTATTATTLQTTDSALTTATDTNVAAPPATATAPAATATAPAEATAAATATTVAPTAVAPTATAVAPTATAAALVVLCNRGCRAPGRCGRFTDNNGSGRCDLSEGIPADQAAQDAQPGGRGG